MLKIAEWFLCAVYSRYMRQAAVPVRRFSIVVLALLGFASIGKAQISDATLSSMGLEKMWGSQLQMPVEEGRIVSNHLWTIPGDRRTFAELTLPPGGGTAALGGNRTLRVSADRLGPDGKAIGIEAAKKEVETQAARLLRRVSGIPAVEVTVPMVYLAVVTSDGFVQTFDAETGEKLWSNSSGSPRFPAVPASVSDAGVVVAHGPELYLFDWKTGKVLSRRGMKRASSAGVALIDNIAFVSSLSGQLMAFNLSEGETLNNWTYRLYGRTVSAPATSHRPNKLVAFATDNGRVTVLSADEGIEPWFDFEARADLAGPISFHGDGLYCGDVAGQITKVLVNRTGLIAWRLMIGDALGAPPVVHNNTVYVTNEIGIMVAADDKTGLPLWSTPVPLVRTILSATKEKVYCRSLTNRLLAIDTASGKILAASAPSVIHTDVINQLNDRVYVISETGQIICLRQRGKEHELPDFHVLLPLTTEVPVPGADQSEAAATGTMEGTTAPAAADPFGAAVGAADAFGTSAAPAAPPAGTALDPFAPTP